MTTTKTPAVAYLTAYTPTGVMEFRTTNYEEVYRFKKTCQSIGCQYSVRLRKVEPTKQPNAHIWNRFKKIFN